jgi:osmoprotectant transport system permease protein
VGESFPHKLARWTLRHLELAGFSLLLSVIIGIPLGIVASRGGLIGQGILGFASVVQTIPSLALLALLVPVPFFGISVRTAIAALFLYGLLPIVRNTASGLQDIRDRCVNLLVALDSVGSPSSGKFIYRWHHARFFRESRPAR